MTANRRYQVAVQNLQPQMYVIELDRPWLDTPFLLQGFLIDSKVELDALIKHCHYVYVDLEQSSPAVADVIRRVEIAGPELAPETAPMDDPSTLTITLGGEPSSDSAFLPARADGTPAPGEHASDTDAIVARMTAVPEASRRRYRPRADVRISQFTRQRFRHFVRQTADARGAVDDSFMSRWFGWLLNRSGRDSGPGRETTRPSTDRTLMPEGMEPTPHQERHAMLQELPRARKAFSLSEASLAGLLGDLRGGRPLQMAPIQSAVDGLVESMLDNPDALLWIARLREEDIHTFNHGVKVALYLIALGRHLGFARQELGYLGQIGMLGDIGKTLLPRTLLDKPGMLAATEFGLVKEHVKLTLQVLAKGPVMPAAVISGIAQHHERMDGSGYPNGLKGDAIGIYGRMAAIADSFAALITPRTYANASSPQDALMNLYEWSGTSFHESMVEQFVQAIGVFPVGSMIELSSGEIGVVVAHNPVRRLEPKVLVLSNPDKSPLAQPLERNLFKEDKDRQGKPLRISRGLPAGAFGFKLRDYYLDDIVRQKGEAASAGRTVA